MILNYLKSLLEPEAFSFVLAIADGSMAINPGNKELRDGLQDNPL